VKKIYVGTSGWSYKDWVGNFYPAIIKQSNYLEYYSRSFNTVEIDSTFYGVPRKATIANWYRMVPDDFKFSSKFPQEITHESGLSGAEDLLKAYLDTMSGLKEKLGPLLLQFPYSFKPEMSENLAKFIQLLPKGFTFIVEIRNKKWLNERFYDMLRKDSIGLALLDHPWMPKVEIATSRTLYVRFLGDRKAIPDDFTAERVDRRQDLDGWERLIRTLEEKVDDFYGYFNNHYSGHSPTTANRFLSLLSERSHGPNNA
jgi:uncharacterized protein YecE (DUF72 family)